MKSLIGKIIYWVVYPAMYIFHTGTHRSRILIVSGEETYLVRDFVGSQKWKLPGGGIKRNEEKTKGAQRELEEELDIFIEEEELMYLGEIDTKTYGVQYFAEIFTYKSSSKKPFKPQIEILEARWFKLNDLPDKRSKLVDKAIELSKS